MNAEYGPLGLNHTLKISGVGYFFNPNTELWERGTCPTALAGMPLSVNAESIHAWIAQGVHVLPWAEDAR